MKIALLGMGRMGRAIGHRFVTHGHDLAIWNRTPGRAPELIDGGAREADSIAAAVAGVDVAITSLANDDAVRDVATGDGGLRSSLAATAVYLDASTVSPALSAELYEAFPRFAAMPVLGSPAAVASGNAVYLIGGDADTIAAVEPLFAALSETFRRYDAPPLATTAKLAVNLMLLDGVVALAESFTVGRAGGLSDDQLRELLGDNPMVPPGLKNRFEGILTGKQEPWWAPSLGAKDATLAVDLVEQAGGQLPASKTVRDLYREAASRASDDDDIVAVARLYRR